MFAVYEKYDPSKCQFSFLIIALCIQDGVSTKQMLMLKTLGGSMSIWVNMQYSCQANIEIEKVPTAILLPRAHIWQVLALYMCM